MEHKGVERALGRRSSLGNALHCVLRSSPASSSMHMLAVFISGPDDRFCAVLRRANDTCILCADDTSGRVVEVSTLARASEWSEW